MKKSERDSLDNILGRRLIHLSFPTTPSKLGTPTTPGGSDDDDRNFDAFDNPMAGIGDLIVGVDDGAPSRLGPGTDGQVLTVQPDLTLAWSDPTGGAGGRYQNLLYELDGVGGFAWITDDDGNPMYVLAELE